MHDGVLGQGNIVDFVGMSSRIFPIGRWTRFRGAILQTSNGDIVNAILRAENKLEKEYLSRSTIRDRSVPARHARGVPLHGETTLPCRVGKLGPYGSGSSWCRA